MTELLPSTSSRNEEQRDSGSHLEMDTKISPPKRAMYSTSQVREILLSRWSRRFWVSADRSPKLVFSQIMRPDTWSEK